MLKQFFNDLLTDVVRAEMNADVCDSAAAELDYDPAETAETNDTTADAGETADGEAQ